MKKINLVLLAVILSLALLLAACANDEAPIDTDQPGTDAPDEDANGDEEVNYEDVAGEITIWFFDTGTEEVVADFNEVYPNVQVNTVLMDWQGHHDNLKTVLAAGSGVPDAFQVESGWWGEFNTMPGLANLLEPPYNLGDFQNDIPEGNYAKTLTPDGSKMWGFSVDFPAAVNFYRADLYEEAGLPTDPGELVNHLVDWDTVFDYAERLKARDRYMFTDAFDIVSLYAWSIHPFDENVEYQLNDDRLVELVDAAKRIEQSGYALGHNIWSEEAQQATSSGELTNIFIGAWFDGSLRNGEWGNHEEDGNWRITTLPGGVYAGQGGTFWGAKDNAENAEAVAAWIRFASIPNLEEYAEDMVEGGTWVPSYSPAWEVEGFDVAHDPLFGDQPVRLAIREIISRVPSHTKTAIDGQAMEIFEEHIRRAIEEGVDSRAALQNAQDDVERMLASDIENVKEAFGIE